MRKILLAVALVVAALFGLALPANAAPTEAQHGNIAVPLSILTGIKFWPYAVANICVANGANELPIGQAAQSWNNATTGLALTFSNNCVNSGYTPSTRMTVDTYDAVDGRCVKLTNTTTSIGDTFDRWTNNPIVWVNMNAAQACGSTAFRRAHWTSYGIGRALGAQGLNSSEWANRVMCMCSQDTVAWPSGTTDGVGISNLYNEVYAGTHI